ncbi:MAG: acyl-CoA thioesterase [Planctomycetes bacterium]|nr:acyl-CoA thioesterase [Planctomycetota bacterium]
MEAKNNIKSHTISIVPRYAETDQAGVVHHTVFPVWLEMGRTELLRVNGMAYSNLEKQGTLFVVAEMKLKYRKPALYDETLALTTTCSKVTAAKVVHKYKLIRTETNELLVEGSTVLACVDKTGKIRRMPNFMFPTD